MGIQEFSNKNLMNNQSRTELNHIEMKKAIPILFLMSLFAISCTDSNTLKNNLAELAKLQAENDSIEKCINSN